MCIADDSAMRFFQLSAYAIEISYLVVGISKVSSRLNDFDDPRSFNLHFNELVSSFTNAEIFVELPSVWGSRINYIQALCITHMLRSKIECDGRAQFQVHNQGNSA